MRSLRQQILVLMLASLLLLATSFIVILGWHMRERAISAAIIKAQSDLATCTEIINLRYPGDWHVVNGILYKGNAVISHQNELVDSLAQLTGDTVTIFLNDTRVATTVRGADGERAIGTKVSDVVAQKVLNNGEVYLGEANVVGQLFQTAYEPLRDAYGNIIGMFYVGISRSYTQEMIANSLRQTAALGAGLTLIVGLLAWLFIEKVIIRPLKNITLGTRDLATGHVTEKVDITGPKEIGELASAFNQMIERLESVAKGFEHYEKESAMPPAGSPVTVKTPETAETSETREIREVEDTHVIEDTRVMRESTDNPTVMSLATVKAEKPAEPIGHKDYFLQTAEVGNHKEGIPDSGGYGVTSQSFTEGNDLVPIVGKRETERDSKEKKWAESLRDLSEKELPKGLNKGTLIQITRFLAEQEDFVSAEDVAEGVKLTRVTVRRYLEFLEQGGILTSELKYGMVGRPVRIWHIR